MRVRVSRDSSRLRQRVAFLALAGLGLLLALIGSRGEGQGPLENQVFAAVSPAVETASDAASGLADFGIGLFAGGALRDRVRSLEQTLQERDHEQALVTELRAENQRLRDLLEMRRALPLKLRGAAVIGENAGAMRSLTLDVGGEDGVETGAAVFTGEGLIGRVVKVSHGSCLVQLIQDASSGVGVTVQRTRRRAVLVGTGSELCLLKYVPKLEPLVVGDVLLTSGTDRLFPPGLQVGVVTAVSDGPGFFKRVDVRPSADPGRSSEVLVVEGPARPREP
jgi:rod shape-determining protein MreC